MSKGKRLALIALATATAGLGYVAWIMLMMDYWGNDG